MDYNYNLRKSYKNRMPGSYLKGSDKMNFKFKEIINYQIKGDFK